MRSKAVRVLLALVAAGALATAAVTSQFGFVLLALGAGLALGSTFSEAGRLVEPLQAYVQRPVSVQAWGAPLPVPGGTAPAPEMTIVSTRSVGAGLHLYLQIEGLGEAVHLKVAQPGHATVEGQTLVIGSAKYIQWAGRRISQAPGAPALAVTLPGAD